MNRVEWGKKHKAMYIEKTNNVIKLEVPGRRTFIFSGAVIGGEKKTTIIAETFGTNGGIILSEYFDKATLAKVKVQEDQSNEYYVVLNGKHYYFSLIHSIGHARNLAHHWLVDDGEMLTYYADQRLGEETFNSKDIVFKNIRSVIWYELLSAYPHHIQGTRSALLAAVFPLTIEAARHHELSRSLSRNTQEKDWNEKAVRAMSIARDNIVKLLKS
jgi:hypothetical protein